MGFVKAEVSLGAGWRNGILSYPLVGRGRM